MVFPMLIFSHLPKTGGTSVVSTIEEYLLRQGVSKKMITIYGRDIDYSNIDPIASSSLPHFCAGHFEKTHLDLLLRSNSFKLCSIRDPFSRFMSRCEHVYRYKDKASSDEIIIGKCLLVNLFLHRESLDKINKVLEDFHFSSFWGGGDKNSFSKHREILLYNQSIYCDAYISIAKINYLVSQLINSLPSTARESMLCKVRSNSWPSKYWKHFSPQQIASVKKGFQAVMKEEIEIISEIKKTLPSLLVPAMLKKFFDSINPS